MDLLLLLLSKYVSILVTFASQNKPQFTGMPFLLLFYDICPRQYHSIMGGDDTSTRQHNSLSIFQNTSQFFERSA